MERKTNNHVGYSRTNLRLTGKNSSHASCTSFKHINCSSGGTDNLTRPRTFNSFSLASHTFKLRNPSTLFSAPIHHKNAHPAQVSPSLMQYGTFYKRINGKANADIQKYTSKSIFRTPFHECSKDANSETPQNFAKEGTRVCVGNKIKHNAGCRSFYAPTISSTQRLIATRSEKKGLQNSSQGSGSCAKKCRVKSNNYSSISKDIPSDDSHSSRRDAMASKIPRERSAFSINCTSESSKKDLSASQNSKVSTLPFLIVSDKARKPMMNNRLPVVGPLGIASGMPENGNLCHSFNEAIDRVSDHKTSSSSLDNLLSATFRIVSGLTNFSRNYGTGRPTESYALGNMHNLCGPSENTKAPSCNNIGRIVEPPVILERIDQKQERSNENVLESGSNLLLRRINFHDQHREMRMDIDNMSYEELLELEEKMGSVSTGLNDEDLTKCLKSSSFKLIHSSTWRADCTEEGNRCSICQEECAVGDNIGELFCEHWYHVVCIQQWLKQKNWCPICKTPAYGQ